ncbi:MAG: efflux RND transporter permease subunit, partial [Planctomycetales bacterium]|nr:efflux RND transporter permease subunit [Planctomycetales bacterium]
AFCARFVRNRIAPHDSAAAVRQRESNLNETSPGLYARLLRGALSARWAVVVVMLLVVAASALLYPRIGAELFPVVDAGTFEIRLRTKPGLRLEETEKLVERVENAIQEIIPTNEIVTLISNIGLPVGKGAGFSTILSPNSGPDTAFMVVNLTQSGRSTSTNEYVERLRDEFRNRFPDEQFLFVTGGIVNAALNEGVATPIDIQVSGGSLEACRQAAESIVTQVRQIPGTADVQIAQALDYPQFDVEVDRIRAKYLGLHQEEIAKTVLTALGSSVGFASTIWIDPSGTDFFMGVQYESNELKSLEDIHNIPLSFDGPRGPVTVPLGNVAQVRRVNIPGEIAHYNIARVNDVYVNVAGRDVGSVAADVDRVLENMEFAPGVSVTVRGPVAAMRDGGATLGQGLLV